MNFFYGLALLFIGLKLTNHIDWSWFWVLLPVTFGGIVLLILLIIAVFTYLFYLIKGDIR